MRARRDDLLPTRGASLARDREHRRRLGARGAVGRRRFKFTIGKHDVIKGFEEGVLGMKVGGRRKLRVPPDLRYGATGSSIEVPPNSTLVFDVELVSID